MIKHALFTTQCDLDLSTMRMCDLRCGQCTGLLHFAEDWLDIGDQELSGVWSINVHDQDFESCLSDEGSLGWEPPDEFMVRLGYARDHGGVEFHAMNISVMDLQDPQDKAPWQVQPPLGFFRRS